MKKNVVIILLSVGLALAILSSAVLCMTVPYMQAPDAEEVWHSYMLFCSERGINANYTAPFIAAGEAAEESIRCVYFEPDDLSVPDIPLPGIQKVDPSGAYVYDLYIFNDGSGALRYAQWLIILTDEEGTWTSESILHEESTTFLPSEEVQIVLDAMSARNYGEIPSEAPAVDADRDGNLTFVVASTLAGDRKDWNGHMITAYNAEADDPCYEIRRAFESIIVSHNAGVIPKNAKKPN